MQLIMPSDLYMLSKVIEINYESEPPYIAIEWTGIIPEDTDLFFVEVAEFYERKNSFNIRFYLKSKCNIKLMHDIQALLTPENCNPNLIITFKSQQSLWQ